MAGLRVGTYVTSHHIQCSGNNSTAVSKATKGKEIKVSLKARLETLLDAAVEKSHDISVSIPGNGASCEIRHMGALTQPQLLISLGDPGLVA